jgi:acetyl esterase/lipase
MRNWLTRIVACLLLPGACLLSGCTGTYLWVINRSVPPPANIESRVYDEAHALSLDVYRPPARVARSVVAAPIVVFIHGGSWQNGSRHGYRFVGSALANGGAIVLVPDYRKAPAYHFPTFMTDAATAVAWARAHAVELGGDPTNIYVMGHSAGAHIAVLLAADRRYLVAAGLEPRDLRGVIALSGPYELEPSDEELMQVVFGKGDWHDANPLEFIDGDEPPFLLMHGSTDKWVPVTDSVDLAGRLQREREMVELEIVPNVGHLAMINGFLASKYSPALARTLGYIGLGPTLVTNAPARTGGGGAAYTGRHTAER